MTMSEGSEGNTYWHHVHGFTTLDGQYIEFEEDAMLPAQRRRDRAIPAQQPSPHRHHHGLRRSLFGILITGVFVLIGILFVRLSFDR
ncbi:hypothetical protein ACFYXH_39560 [Streptomyces sp. NPDC002730]|uniref:hypothetical protein n=1 Tax=Streptomyces sp. NPDC002730 TaxID=3364662 RepID=UPI00369436C6